MTKIIEITNEAGDIIEGQWLAKAEFVHRQLRTLSFAPDYAGKMKRVFAGGGRMCVATRAMSVVGLAVYRVYENTFDGKLMYVDDLVTDDAARSTGVGKALMDHLQSLARNSGCDTYSLDSGVQRQRAHKFYFREGMFVTSFHFRKAVT